MKRSPSPRPDHHALVSSPMSQRTPLLQDDERGSMSTDSAPEPQPVVSWASLPNKGQLAVIVCARLAEPLSERSLTSYLFYQLQWFNPDLDASEIVQQAGYLTATFAAAQCLTSMWWGRLADDPRLGRKRVLVIGLLGSALSALGMGFTTSIWAAFCFRFMAGSLNGNIGVLRTMVSEIVVDKRFRPRAFLLLPMCFNVGVIIGPLLSGFLADPIHTLPGLFGPGSVFGGTKGVRWLEKFPYALPNLLCFTILSIAALGVILCLDETHPSLRSRPDAGRRVGKRILRQILGSKSTGECHYDALYTDDGSATPDSVQQQTGTDDTARVALGSKPSKTAPFRAVLTRNVCMTMLQRFLQSIHVSAFNSMFFTLIPTPHADPRSFRLPFRFSGGLGLSSEKMGFANTTIGIIGIPLQLIVYPRLIGRLGVRSSYQIFLPLSIVAYFLLPYLVLLPADNMLLIWTCLSGVIALQVLSRTFVNPATMLLVNEAAPSPDLLGTVHGMASSISSAGRITGPVIGGTLLGWGLGHNFVGLPMWCLGLVAGVNWVILWWIEDVNMS